MERLDKPLPDILAIARSDFALDCKGYKRDAFYTYRGLQRDETTNSGLLRGYLEWLPMLHDQDFIAVVDEKIADRNADTGNGSKVRIVDIGYGDGRFLLQCRARWGDDVELYGYGTDAYAKTPSKLLNQFTKSETYLPPTIDGLQNAGVHLVNGNFIDIRRELGDNFADVIVSVHALQHVYYPNWEKIKKIYRTLAPDGVALINNTGIKQNFPNQTLEAYLETNGYDFQFRTVRFWHEPHHDTAFRKTNPDLTVPIRSIGKVSDGTIHIWDASMEVA